MLCYIVLGMVEQSVVGERIYHIVETPGALDLLAEEGPTDEYYNRLRQYMGKKFPGASGHLLDHLEALESFLDRSIAAGMTFGIDKACVAVVEGNLLGHNIGRNGAKCNAEKTRAILKFPALKERLHIQQFLGCTNFLRSYLPPEYAHCAKLLGEYVKGATPFPDDGLRPGPDTTTDPAGLGKLLTVLLRHGRGVVEEELKKYVSVGGWVQIEKVKEWLGVEPTGGELLRRLEAACVHPDSKGRIEMGEVQSDPEKRYIWARRSWSIPWITEGLDEADVRNKPAELFHATRRTNWESIKRYGLMNTSSKGAKW